MNAVAMSGNDTVTINNRVLADFPGGDVAHLTYPNDIANLKTGKNGNTIYAFNASGKQCDMEVRLLRGSADDVFMNGLLTQQKADFAAFPLMIGELVKKIGDGKANVKSDTYVLSGGIHTKQVEAKINVDGDVEQSVVIYKLKFSNAPRAIT
jgi:hypothetical protein